MSHLLMNENKVQRFVTSTSRADGRRERSCGQGSRIVLGARCGESRSPVLSPSSKEPGREAGPAAMGGARP